MPRRGRLARPRAATTSVIAIEATSGGSVGTTPTVSQVGPEPGRRQRLEIAAQARRPPGNGQRDAPLLADAGRVDRRACPSARAASETSSRVSKLSEASKTRSWPREKLPRVVARRDRPRRRARAGRRVDLARAARPRPRPSARCAPRPRRRRETGARGSRARRRRGRSSVSRPKPARTRRLRRRRADGARRRRRRSRSAPIRSCPSGPIPGKRTDREYRRGVRSSRRRLEQRARVLRARSPGTFSPASIRAISATRSRPSSSRTDATVRPPTSRFSARKCGSRERRDLRHVRHAEHLLGVGEGAQLLARRPRRPGRRSRRRPRRRRACGRGPCRPRRPSGSRAGAARARRPTRSSRAASRARPGSARRETTPVSSPPAARRVVVRQASSGDAEARLLQREALQLLLDGRREARRGGRAASAEKRRRRLPIGLARPARVLARRRSSASSTLRELAALLLHVGEAGEDLARSRRRTCA